MEHFYAYVETREQKALVFKKKLFWRPIGQGYSVVWVLTQATQLIRNYWNVISINWSALFYQNAAECKQEFQISIQKQ